MELCPSLLVTLRFPLFAPTHAVKRWIPDYDDNQIIFKITNNVQVKDKDTHPGLIPAFEAMKVFVPLTVHHRVPRLHYPTV